MRNASPADFPRTVDAAARSALGFIWIFQGLVPKILTRWPAEVEMCRPLARMMGIPPEWVLIALSGAETAMGVALFAFWRRRWPYAASLALLAAVNGPALVTLPTIYVDSFSPTVLVAAMLALTFTGWRAHGFLLRSSKP